MVEHKCRHGYLATDCEECLQEALAVAIETGRRFAALLRRGAQLARDLADQAAPVNPFARVAAHVYCQEVEKALEDKPHA